MGQSTWQTGSGVPERHDAALRTSALALCAPALLSIWLQYNAYSFFYFAGTSIENNGLLLLRGSLNILLGMMFPLLSVTRRPRAYTAFSLAGFALMTISSLLFFAMGWGVVGPVARFAFDITGTLGIIACAISWANLLSRMDLRITNASIVASCGIGAFVGALIGLLPGTAYGVAMLFVPVLLLIAYRYLGARAEAFCGNHAPTGDDRTGREQFEPGLAIKLVIGMCLLAAGIGFGIEYRFSGSEALPAAYAAAHQFVLAALCLLCLVLAAREIQLGLGQMWVGMPDMRRCGAQPVHRRRRGPLWTGVLDARPTAGGGPCRFELFQRKDRAGRRHGQVLLDLIWGVHSELCARRQDGDVPC